MRRGVGLTVGTVLAGSVAVSGMSTAAQAVTLPGPAAFGISPVGYVALPAGTVAKFAGGLSSLCMLGTSCPTRILDSTNGEKAFFESAGTAKSKKDASRRLAQARSADRAGLAADGYAISWSKVKLKKAWRAEGIKVWAASAPLDIDGSATGEPAKLVMAQAGRRIAFVVAVPDAPVSHAKFSTALVKLVAGKKKLSKLTGPSGGSYLTTVKLR